MNRPLLFILTIFIITRASTLVQAQPTVGQALVLTPMQRDVEVDRPAGAEVKDCSVGAEDTDGQTAWVVRGAAGEPLRRFVDSNGDNRVDQWCYFHNGIEVYRDIDADFNGKADQYRWLGTAGIRWGLDADEDGRIEHWKTISAEEVTAEVVMALRDRDALRFNSLLLDPAELKSLELGAAMTEKISQRIEQAKAGFPGVAAKQTTVGRDAKWVDFGGLRPGVVPRGAGGLAQDLVVYENVVAMAESAGKHQQLQIGTLVQAGPAWRLIGMPSLDGQDSSRTAFVFFEAAPPAQNQAESSAAEGVNEETQKLIAALEELDAELARASQPQAVADLNARRADTLEKLVASTAATKERDMWRMQLVDTVSAAAQSTAWPDGAKRLQTLYEQLKGESTNKELLAHLGFALLTSEYATSLQASDADYAKIQEKWLADLEEFVKEYPGGKDVPEAMLQLGLAQEFAGEDESALGWYSKIVSDFPGSALATKAAGAKTRLDSVGKPIQLVAPTLDGKQFDLKRYRGKLVLVHYWASWCEPCKDDITLLRRLHAEYGRKNFVVVGVNLDDDRSALEQFVRAQKLPWPQLYEAGGLENRLATEMGIFTLPVGMILIDATGKVVNRQIHAGELEQELAKRIR